MSRWAGGDAPTTPGAAGRRSAPAPGCRAAGSTAPSRGRAAASGSSARWSSDVTQAKRKQTSDFRTFQQMRKLESLRKSWKLLPTHKLLLMKPQTGRRGRPTCVHSVHFGEQLWSWTGGKPKTIIWTLQKLAENSTSCSVHQMWVNSTV